MTRVSRTLRRGGAVHGFAVALMLAAVLLLAAAGSFRILCVGEDGHVAFEPINSSCCGTEAPSTGDLGGDGCGPGGDDGCGDGDCADVVVGGDASRVDRGPAPDVPGPDAVPPTSPLAVAKLFAQTRGPAAHPDPGVPRGSLAALRTVVLRR